MFQIIPTKKVHSSTLVKLKMSAPSDQPPTEEAVEAEEEAAIVTARRPGEVASTVGGQVTSLGRGVSQGKEMPSVPSSGRAYNRGSVTGKPGSSASDQSSSLSISLSAIKITSGSSSGNSTLVGESSVGRRDKSSLLWGSTSWSCSLSM